MSTKRRRSPGIRNFVWFKSFGFVRKVPCFYCEELVTFKGSTIDHKTPISRGGKYRELSNLAITCWSCNHYKGNRTEGEFWRLLIIVSKLSQRSLGSGT